MHAPRTLRAPLTPAASAVAAAAGGATTGRDYRGFLDVVWAMAAGAAGSQWPGTGSRPRGTPARGPEEQARIRALVALAQDGDREAFGQLYDLYVDTVFRYLLVRVGDRQLAEDLTAETFIRALRRIDGFTWQGRDLAAWLVTIARNLVADHVKSARFRFEVTTDDMRDADERVDAPDDEVLTRLRDERIVEAIRGLGSDQAECITLRFLQGLSLAETAEVLGRSQGAVKQLQLRAIRALRAALEGVDL